MEAATYGAAELARNARKLFDTTPEAVTVALKTAGKEEATVEEAAAIIKAFLEKEVK